jgi:UDP-2,3-diacylglucosamine pyrophosphatase LpxH
MWLTRNATHTAATPPQGLRMSTLRFRSVFVSDVHLGTPDCQAEYLLDFLRAMRCETLYLVGDIVDLEALAQRPYWPPSHSAIVAELLAIAHRGTRVIYLPGNHDAPMRALCGQRIGGIELEWNACHVAADGRRYRVAHGDEFDPEHIGRSWLIRLGDSAHRLLLWTNRNFNRLRRRLRLAYLPLAIITKSRVAQALLYIRQYESRVAAAAREHGVDGHICGHIHFGGVREIEGVVYLNDGDWVEHCTALTEDFEGRMSLLHWSEHRTRIGSVEANRVHPSQAACLAFASLSAHAEAVKTVQDALKRAA